MNKDKLLVTLDIILNSDDKNEINQKDLYYSDELKIYETLVNYAYSLLEVVETDDTYTIKKCIKILNSVEDMGKNNVIWNYNIGYAYYLLNKYEKTHQFFSKTLELIEKNNLDSDDIKDIKTEAETILDECKEQIEKEKLENSFLHDHLNKEKAQDYINHCLIPQAFQGEAIQIRGDSIYIFDKEITIKSSIAELSQNTVILYFSVQQDSWGHDIGDYFIGTGKDTNEALNIAVKTFIETLYDGVNNVINGQYIDEFTINFKNKDHIFNTYYSNILSIGDCPVIYDNALYYGLIKEELKKRIGNQNLVFVSLVMSKDVDGSIITDCRVNGKQSNDISNIIATELEQWDCKDFASQKMYILLEQDKNTLDPYPYYKSNGYLKFKSHIKTIIDKMYEYRHDVSKDNLKADLYNTIDDKVLVDLAINAIPEVCAKDAYSQIKYPEFVYIQDGDVKHKYYLSQLNDLDLLEKAIYEIFDENTFLDKTNKIFRFLISSSLRFKEYGDYLDKNVDISYQVEPLLFSMSENMIR